MNRLFIILPFIFFNALHANSQPDSVFFKCYKKDNTISLDKEIYRSAIDDINNKIIVENTRLTPTGWVNDFEKILDKEQQHHLDSLCDSIEKETTIEIAIVTIDSAYIRKGKFDSLILNLARTWGVGKKSTNKGILIGISSSLRKIRISNGPGITDRLSDMETKQIIDEVMIPEFREKKYYHGLEKGLMAIMAALKKEKE